MKKILWIVTAVVVLTLVGCNGNESKLKAKYQALGQDYAARLDDACQRQDVATVLAVEDSIRLIEQEVVQTEDTAAIAAYRAAIKDALKRNDEYVAKVKVDNGKDREETLQQVVNDGLNNDVDITTVTRSIQATGVKKSDRNR